MGKSVFLYMHPGLLCQHKMLSEMTLLTHGSAVVLTVVTNEDPTGSLEAVAAHASQ